MTNDSGHFEFEELFKKRFPEPRISSLADERVLSASIAAGADSKFKSAWWPSLASAVALLLLAWGCWDLSGGRADVREAKASPTLSIREMSQCRYLGLKDGRIYFSFPNGEIKSMDAKEGGRFGNLNILECTPDYISLEDEGNRRLSLYLTHGSLQKGKVN